MSFYNNRVVQILSVILYPITAFVILSNGRAIGSWAIPAVIAILFCFLWKNLSHLMISNVLLWVVAIPMWWLLIERSSEDQGAEIFISSLPFIILSYIFIVLLPEVLIVSLRNLILGKFIQRNDE
ncbi:hypothetical protein P4H61_07435 [Paenibacillus peoriae]|uniref:hypothetical protein n=1 Tax=Paenibacillus peoriae TaxID=59893 RepID=UPI00026C5A21|nr:hypothetical protein [Paenibacillus peoriae]MEC0181331.1 hypothetical protein [Paenibacillus peoriae]